tara:strand:- start:167 stop:451 length:285 start_codon:yes stop_codon:yes gene_type:complete
MQSHSLLQIVPEAINKERRLRQMTEIKTLVQIADQNGHTSAMMTREETLEAVAENSGAWVFNGEGQMVQPAQLAEADFGTIGTVRIVPGLVGGL